MSKPFDSALKDLFKQHPSDLAPLLGLEATPLRSLPTNLVANLDTDLVLGVGDPVWGVIDLNFQTRWDEDTPYRIFCYNALLHRHHRVPIHSAVILLKSRENDLRLERGIQYSLFAGRGRMEFYPEVVRIWEQPLESMLTEGINLLPLAPLAAMPEGIGRAEAMPEILRRIQVRLRSEASPEQMDQLTNLTYNVAGIHFKASELVEFARRSQSMLSDLLEDSYTWNDTLDRGRRDAIKKAIERHGTRKFGPITETARVRLTALEEIPHLERILDAILDTASWEETLATL